MATKRSGGKRKARAKAGKPAAAAKFKSGQQKKDLTDLQAMVDRLIQAKDRSDDHALGTALQDLAGFRERPLALPLLAAADEARAVARHPITTDSLRLLRDIAARLKAVPPADRAAKSRPASAVHNLLLPKVATTANSMLDAVLELQQATESMKAQLEKPKDLGNLPQALTSVKSSLEKLKARAKALQR